MNFISIIIMNYQRGYCVCVRVCTFPDNLKEKVIHQQKFTSKLVNLASKLLR